MRYFLTLVLLIASIANADRAFEGGISSRQEVKVLELDRLYVVPPCRRWLLRDVRNFSKGTWVEIDGLLELRDSPREGSLFHKFAGKFTYGASENNHTMYAIVQPGAKVTAKSISGRTTSVLEYSWIQLGEKCQK